jgi:DNA-directed RNA polymerase subunit RPC12/RpoP
MNIDATVLREKLKLGAEDYDFYRCYKCGALITRIDEILFFTAKSKTAGSPCPCGSKKYSPTNPKWWEYFTPKVARFAYYRLKGVA